MLRDAFLLAGKAGKGAPYARFKRPSLSPQAQQVVAHHNPELLEGFLIYRPRLRTAKLSRAKKAAKPSANMLNFFGILQRFKMLSNGHKRRTRRNYE